MSRLACAPALWSCTCAQFVLGNRRHLTTLRQRVRKKEEKTDLGQTLADSIRKAARCTGRLMHRRAGASFPTPRPMLLVGPGARPGAIPRPRREPEWEAHLGGLIRGCKKVLLFRFFDPGPGGTGGTREAPRSPPWAFPGLPGLPGAPANYKKQKQKS